MISKALVDRHQRNAQGMYGIATCTDSLVDVDGIRDVVVAGQPASTSDEIVDQAVAR